MKQLYRLIAIIFFLLFSSQIQAQNIMKLGDVSVQAVNELHSVSMTALSGETKTLDFTINNMEAFTAFQFDIPLPTTMQYVAGSAILLRKQDHQVSCSIINNNTLRVVAFSASNKAFTGTDGKVLSLDFKIVGQAGWYPINISNGIISDAAGLNAMSATYNGSLQVAAAQISAPQQIDFGDVSILGSKTQSLRVTNNGGDALKIDQLIFSDPSFTSTQSLPLVIPVGNYADVPVTFSKNSKGIISATSGIIKVKGHNDCGDGVESSLAITVNEAGKNNLTVKGTTGCSGTDVMVTLEVDNGLPFIALQCDLKYPAYLTPKMSNITLTDRATDHNIQTSLPVANTLRVLAYSLSLQAFKGKTGAVVQIPFTINSNALAGSYALELSNVTLGNSQSQNIIDNSYNGTVVISTGPSVAGAITGNTNIWQETTNITYSVPAITGATSYIWTLPTGAMGTSTTNTISLNYGRTAVSGNLKVKGNNACGDGTEASLAISVCLGVGIEDAAITNKVEIYPSPTLNEFYVTINKPFKNDFKVEVCNSFGQILQTILKNKNNNKFSVDLTSYPTGLYFVRFSDKETHFHCKIIKQ